MAETFSFSFLSLLMTLCNEFDAKNTPDLLRAPTAALQLDVCESEAVSPVSVLSPGVKIWCQEGEAHIKQGRPPWPIWKGSC